MDGHYIEARTVLWAAAEVPWQDATCTSYRVPATLEDTSLSGACIRVQRPFTIGSRIVAKWQREQFAAVARNCRSDGHGFLLGLRGERNDGPKPAVQTHSTERIRDSIVASEVSRASERPDQPLARKSARSNAWLSPSEPKGPSSIKGAPLRSRRLRPLAEPLISQPPAQPKVSGSSPVPKGKLRNRKRSFHTSGAVSRTETHPKPFLRRLQ